MAESQSRDLNSSLSSLAMLSVQLSAGKDYLDYLHGFVIEALRHLEGRLFDAASVQKVVEQEFGLKIPAATYAVYLKRLIKEGAVTAVPVAGALSSEQQYCLQ